MTTALVLLVRCWVGWGGRSLKQALIDCLFIASARRPEHPVALLLFSTVLPNDGVHTLPGVHVLVYGAQTGTAPPA